MEDLGNQYCASDPTNSFYDFEYIIRLYSLLFIIGPFGMLTIFDQRLRNHMDPLLWYIMIIVLTISVQGVLCQLICEDTFNDLFRATFLHLIDVDANDDTIRGLFFYSGEVFWLLAFYCGIAISSLFSLEIRDIVKNPFEAKT